MNILCMDLGLLVPALQALGHNVIAWNPEGSGVYDLPAFLHECGFRPDLLIQAESLGPRRVLSGLEEVKCPRIFWAIDSHLNLYWQKYYARLFDAVLTPHLSLWEALPAGERHPLVRQMARQGTALPWRPHQERQHLLSFVGVQDKHRPLRTWLCELIASRFPLVQRQNISFAEMLALYQDTCIVPNEAIAFEVNYRLMETASAGALPLTPDIGPDQDALFEPGREMVVYRNACELMEKLEALQADPKRTERIAHAAWQRIQREHLPIHRAEQIIRLAESIQQERLPEEYGGFSRQFFFAANLWMARMQGARGGRGGFSGPAVKNTPPLSAFPAGEEQNSETLNLQLRFLLETSNAPRLLPLIREYFQSGAYPENAELAAAASFGALRLGDPELAAGILASAGAGLSLNNPLPGQASVEDALPTQAGQSPLAGSPIPGAWQVAFCLCWAEVLLKRGHRAVSGFTFDPCYHLPASSLDVLIYLEMFFPGQSQEAVLTLVNLALLGDRAFAYFHLGYLARQALAQPANWQIQLEYGMANLVCYRMQEGLHELNEAARKAAQAGQQPIFSRLLALHDPSGAIVRQCRLEYN